MSEPNPIPELTKRQRRPGELVFGALCLCFSLFLAWNLSTETTWAKGTKFLAQPAFWPHLAIYGMVVFSVLHLLSLALSQKMAGRRTEVVFWLRSCEFAGWFMIYVIGVPLLGYLPMTLAFMIALAWRLGYRTWQWVLATAGLGFAIVVLFKSFLQVKVPGGAAYEYLPPAMRSLFLTYF